MAKLDKNLSDVFEGASFQEIDLNEEINEVNENAGTIRNEELPSKPGIWDRFRAFWLQEIDWNQEIVVELTPAQQKVEDEINNFLHQEITWEGIKNFLFKEIKFGK